MGNQVDSAGLAMNLDSLNGAGFGGVHIIPIYGKKGEKGPALLSEDFNRMVLLTIRLAHQRCMFVDLTLGSGWPYGGPDIPVAYRAKQVIPVISRRTWPKLKPDQLAVAHYTSNDSINWLFLPSADSSVAARYHMIIAQQPTYQQVKRAAPGGEGYVIDHFNPDALQYYLQRFKPLFDALDKQRAQLSKQPTKNCPQPPGIRNFFMDSYEVFKANYSPLLTSRYKSIYGDDPAPKLKYLFTDSTSAEAQQFRIRYHKVIQEQLSAFIKALPPNIRIQAHGAPANIIDLYGLTPFPETESFGSKADPIRGHEPDPDYQTDRYGQPDFYTMKLATSNRFGQQHDQREVSAETGTWLNEHFNEDLAALKIRVDELLLAGVNRIGLHGAAYQSTTDTFPGHRFYASMHVGPNGHLMRKVKFINQYISRVASQFAQEKADTVKIRAYVVIDPSEEWAKIPPTNRLVHMQETHFSHLWMAKAQAAAKLLRDRNIPFDFVTPADLQQYAKFNYKRPSINDIITRSKFSKQDSNIQFIINKLFGSRLVIIPEYKQVSRELADCYKPGLREDSCNRRSLPKRAKVKQDFNYRAACIRYCYKELFNQGVYKASPLVGSIDSSIKISHDLEKSLERIEPYRFLQVIKGQGIESYYYNEHNFFIRNGDQQDSVFTLKLAGQRQKQIQFPQVSGRWQAITTDAKGLVTIQLPSGMSCIIRDRESKARLEPYQLVKQKIALPISLKRIDRLPDDSPGPFRYSGSIRLTSSPKHDILLRLPKVNQTAEVLVNGKYAGTVWAHPKELVINRSLLKTGRNTLLISVLPDDHNRIMSYERQHPDWKQFQDINFVNIKYQPFDSRSWTTKPVGLLAPPQLFWLVR